MTLVAKSQKQGADWSFLFACAGTIGDDFRTICDDPQTIRDDFHTTGDEFRTIRDDLRCLYLIKKEKKIKRS